MTGEAWLWTFFVVSTVASFFFAGWAACSDARHWEIRRILLDMQRNLP